MGLFVLYIALLLGKFTCNKTCSPLIDSVDDVSIRRIKENNPASPFPSRPGDIFLSEPNSKGRFEIDLLWQLHR